MAWFGVPRKGPQQYSRNIIPVGNQTSVAATALLIASSLLLKGHHRWATPATNEWALSGLQGVCQMLSACLSNQKSKQTRHTCHKTAIHNYKEQNAAKDCQNKNERIIVLIYVAGERCWFYAPKMIRILNGTMSTVCTDRVQLGWGGLAFAGGDHTSPCVYIYIHTHIHITIHTNTSLCT